MSSIVNKSENLHFRVIFIV